MNGAALYNLFIRYFGSDVVAEVDHKEDWEYMVTDWLKAQGCTDREITALLMNEFKFTP